MLYYLFFLHWLSDFVFQIPWMANNKSHNRWALLLHCIVYSSVLGAGLYWLRPEYITLPEFGLFIFFNLCAHYLTDSITSKITSYFYKKEQFYLFFVTIGLDQFIHIATLLLSCQLIIEKVGGHRWLT